MLFTRNGHFGVIVILVLIIFVFCYYFTLNAAATHFGNGVFKVASGHIRPVYAESRTVERAFAVSKVASKAVFNSSVADGVFTVAQNEIFNLISYGVFLHIFKIVRVGHEL